MRRANRRWRVQKLTVCANGASGSTASALPSLASRAPVVLATPLGPEWWIPRLGGGQHWRLCPKCGSIAMSHNIDDSSICGSAFTAFAGSRPTLRCQSTRRELFQEIRWAYDDRLRRTPDAKLSWMELARSVGAVELATSDPRLRAAWLHIDWPS